jgi:hypothetical protein
MIWVVAVVHILPKRGRSVNPKYKEKLQKFGKILAFFTVPVVRWNPDAGR